MFASADTDLEAGWRQKMDEGSCHAGVQKGVIDSQRSLASNSFCGMGNNIMDFISLTAPSLPFSRRTLKKRSDFLKIIKEGRKIVTPTVIVQVLFKKNLDKETHSKVRFGFTATRKIGPAVTRNRARRRLRAVVDVVAKEKTFMPGDYVLVARQHTSSVDFEVLKNDFKKALKHVG